MPRGYPLSDAQKKAIYHAYTEGERQRDIAATYGITAKTVSKIVNEQRKMVSMAAHEKIVAGDKANGRLTSTTDPHRFEGTCVIAGKKHSKTFTTVNARKATEMWEKWCQDLRDEDAFMDMVERKPREGEAVCGYPSDPIEEIKPAQTSVPKPKPAPDIEVRPWRDVAEEREKRIKELEAEVAGMRELVEFCQRVEGAVKAGEPLDLWGTEYVMASATDAQASETDHAYLVWAKGDKPKCYGIYQHMSPAMSDMDKLNSVASFLGLDGVFDVEEVSWKG